MVSGSSAIKPQTPVGNRKYINIVQADRGWRPSENNNKHVELVPIWGWGGVGKGNLNPRLSVENRSDTYFIQTLAGSRRDERTRSVKKLESAKH